MKDIYFCGVQFYKYADELGEKIYKFSVSKELIDDIFEGSYVMVDTKFGPRMGVVTKFYTRKELELKDSTKLREVISVIDLTDYFNKKAIEKRKEELLEEIDNQVKKSSKLQLARTLAEQDDTLSSLLKEFDELGD
mgnify:CR=1 FL=1